MNLLPGKQLCESCNSKVEEAIESLYRITEEEKNWRGGEESASSSQGVASSSKSSVNSFKNEEILTTSSSRLDLVTNTLGASPVKDTTKLNLDQRNQYAKRKFVSLGNSLCEELSTVCGVETVGNSSLQELELCAQFQNNLMSSLRDKIKTSTSKSEIKQLLSLAPGSDLRSREWVSQTLNVSEHLVRESRKLTAKQGILPRVTPKRSGKRIPEWVLTKIQEFFDDPEISRPTPGIKDYKKVKMDGTAELIGKRLLLFDLSEAHDIFRKENPAAVIGLSRFCMLRPAWVITVAASGTHVVCVCIYHQAPKLMAEGAGLEHWKTLMNLLVCSMDNELCMLNQVEDCRCENCPPPIVLKNCLEEELDGYENIRFKKWTTVDRATFGTEELKTEEFIDELVRQLRELCAHHFTAQAQSAYFKHLKMTITVNVYVFNMDFAENYGFVVQNATQGYHWTNDMVTLHPMVLYYLENGVKKVKSFCMISDDLTHDTAAVHSFLREFVKEVKEINKDVEKLYAWTDGGPAHYKNRKAFANTSFSKQDFGIEIESHFTPTCHGKNSGDGIGGAVKRLVRRAALHGVTINTPRLFYEWAKANIKNIKFIYVESTTIELDREKLKPRFDAAKTIEGTHKLHAFIPISPGVLKVSRISNPESKVPSQIVRVIDSLTPTHISAYDLFEDDFIACVYGESWAIGQMLEQNDDGIKLKLMQPHGKAVAYNWKEKEEVFLKIEDILQKLPAPASRSRATRGCRPLGFPQEIMAKIEKEFNVRNKISYLGAVP